MTGGVLILVESNTTGNGRRLVRIAKERDLTPLLLSADPGRYDFVRLGEVVAQRVDTADRAALGEACREVPPADLRGITTTSDHFVASAAALAGRLGLPAPDPDAVLACRDKGAQREILEAAGVSVPGFTVASTVRDAVAAWRAAHGRDVVVKPVTGSGSVGVRLCRNAEEVAAQASRLLACPTDERGAPIPARVLVEEAVAGQEVSVEVVSGQVVGVTGKHLGRPPAFVEIGHDHPAPIAEEAARAAEAMAVKALAALDVGAFAAHVELRLTEDGPIVIEVNPRLPGGGIVELVSLATGIDMVSGLLDVVLGSPTVVRSRYRAAAAVRFLMPSEGAAGRRVYRIQGVEESMRMPGVVDSWVTVADGRPLVVSGDFRDRIGQVMAIARTAEDAGARAERALARIVIELEPRRIEEERHAGKATAASGSAGDSGRACNSGRARR